MSYGCGETSETNTNTTQYSDEYWSNPPSDVYSEEYRIWYERYCSYFYPQSASETVATSSSVDSNNTAGLDAYSESINGSSVNSTTVTTVTTTTATDAEKPSDDAVDSSAGSTAGKKRKKNKKTDLANPKPAEPPGVLQFYVDIFFQTHWHIGQYCWLTEVVSGEDSVVLHLIGNFDISLFSVHLQFIVAAFV